MMIIDAAVVARLESTAARLNAMVAASMSATGNQQAAAVEWCGSWLVSLGAGRYINRAVGIGTAEVSDADIDAMERFFDERGVPPMVETSTWAAPSLLRSLAARGYGPAWFRNVFVQPLNGPAIEPTDDAIQIEEVDAARVEAWRDVLARGNGLDAATRSVSDEYADARHAMAEGQDFLAVAGGRPVGCASLEMIDGVAWLGGAATVPQALGRGVQAALLRHRLALARAAGSELAAATAVPPGPSSRNLQRHGFALAYTQVELLRTMPAPPAGA